MTNNIRCLLYIFFLISFESCKSIQTYQIECYSITANNGLILELETSRKNVLKNYEEIKLEAIEGLLFRGITGANCISQKSILTKERGELKSNKLIKDIYGKGLGYNKYITNITNIKSEQSSEVRNGKFHYKFRITVNKELLLKDLMKAGLLKPLDAGF